MSASISVCIVCRNEADRLRACLESVRWADEVIVVDLESTDESADVARSLGATVHTHAPVPIVELVRNTAADLASCEWVLAMDPDERVTPGLAGELRALSSRDDVDVVLIPFQNLDFGFAASHPMHRYDPKPRMYRRAAIRWPETPNELPPLDDARVFAIPPDDRLVMRHERNRNLPEVLDRVVRYAPAEARALRASGQAFTAKAMLAAVGRKAWKQFVVGRPFDDGVPGFYRASTLVLFHFYVWLELWQQSGSPRTPTDDAAMRRIGRAARAAEYAGRAAARARGALESASSRMSSW